jgi:Tfp pilus assembly protein PilF
MAYAKVGQKLQAQHELQEALRIDPTSPNAGDTRKALAAITKP